MDWGLIALSICIAMVVVGSYWDTKARIARIEHKLNLLLKHHDIDLFTDMPVLSDRVREIAKDPARKIEAIKVYREETGVGLAEAKTAVEAYMHSM